MTPAVVELVAGAAQNRASVLAARNANAVFASALANAPSVAASIQWTPFTSTRGLS